MVAKEKVIHGSQERRRKGEIKHKMKYGHSFFDTDTFGPLKAQLPFLW